MLNHPKSRKVMHLLVVSFCLFRRHPFRTLTRLHLNGMVGDAATTSNGGLMFHEQISNSVKMLYGEALASKPHKFLTSQSRESDPGIGAISSRSTPLLFSRFERPFFTTVSRRQKLEIWRRSCLGLPIQIWSFVNYTHSLLVTSDVSILICSILKLLWYTTATVPMWVSPSTHWEYFDMFIMLTKKWPASPTAATQSSKNTTCCRDASAMNAFSTTFWKTSESQSLETTVTRTTVRSNGC